VLDDRVEARVVDSKPAQDRQHRPGDAGFGSAPPETDPGFGTRTAVEQKRAGLSSCVLALHGAPVLASDLVEGVADLTQRA
jgi:hypothetical protein